MEKINEVYEAYIATYDSSQFERYFSDSHEAIKYIKARAYKFIIERANSYKQHRLSAHEDPYWWLHLYSIIVKRHYVDSDKKSEYILTLELEQFYEQIKKEGRS